MAGGTGQAPGESTEPGGSETEEPTEFERVEPRAGQRDGDHGPAGADGDGTDGEPVTAISETSLVEVSKSRLRVLKELEGGRRTASELARALELNKSTVHGYLQDLVEDGFLRRHEADGRIWVYYSLSETGQAIVDRDRLTILVDLGTILAFVGSAALGLYQFLAATEETTGGGPGIQGGPSPGPSPDGLPWLAIAYGALLVLVLAGMGLNVWLRRREIRPSPGRGQP